MARVYLLVKRVRHCLDFCSPDAVLEDDKVACSYAVVVLVVVVLVLIIGIVKFCLGSRLCSSGLVLSFCWMLLSSFLSLESAGPCSQRGWYYGRIWPV